MHIRLGNREILGVWVNMWLKELKGKRRVNQRVLRDEKMGYLKNIWFKERWHVKLGDGVVDFILHLQNEIILYIMAGLLHILKRFVNFMDGFICPGAGQKLLVLMIVTYEMIDMEWLIAFSDIKMKSVWTKGCRVTAIWSRQRFLFIFNQCVLCRVSSVFGYMEIYKINKFLRRMKDV